VCLLWAFQVEQVLECRFGARRAWVQVELLANEPWSKFEVNVALQNLSLGSKLRFLLQSTVEFE
jgi:hypothetical protein